MLPCRLLTTLALITCILNVRSQYFDFIQGIQALIQPYQAQNPFYAQTTKRPQTTQKKIYDDVIVFQDDSRKKTTTSRPRKITNKNIQEIGRKFVPNLESTTQIYSIKRIQNDFPSAITFIDQDRRIETNFNVQSTRNPIQENKKNINNFSRPQKINTGFDNKPQKHKTQENFQSATHKYVTTHKPGHSNHVINNTPMYDTNQIYNKNQNYNENRNQETNTNNKNTAYNQYTSNNQGYTTNNQGYTQYNQGYTSNNQGNPRNPLVNQPGVKPANVDENQPPITNSPVTDSIFNFPDVANDEFEPPIEIGPNEENMSQSEKRRYVEIAEEVCNEYMARNVKKVVALPLSHSSQGRAVNVSDCTPINIPLILGGTVVSSIKEFPHMALVGWRLILGGYSWKCGGSLLSSQFVLTAGHCTFQEKDNNAVSGPPQAVQLGSAIMDDPRATVVQVASVIRHPKYKRRRVYHDVALIKLVQEVVFSEMIRPACLGRPPGVDEPIIATGWGRTEFGGSQSRELRSVSLPIWNMDECREVWGTSRKLPNGPMNNDQICAGEKSGGKDTCQGDSGGPAQVQDGCVWRVVAVTSYGRSCGAPLTPALYARIPIPFVAAKVYEDRVRQTTNRLQNNYGTTAGYDGYQNDGNPNYKENQGYRPNNNQNGYTLSFNQNDRVSPIYNQQQPNYNRENYGNQNVNQPNNFNTQSAQYINPSYEIPDSSGNQPKYGNQQIEPNYGFEPNYSVQVNRPWWSK